MPLYIVRVEEVRYFHVKVKADTEEVARLKAEDGIGIAIDLVKENVVGTIVGEYPTESESEKN